MPWPFWIAQAAFWLPHAIKGLDLVIKSKQLIPSFKASSWVTLRVGGVDHLTLKKTLISRRSLFSALFKDRWFPQKLTAWERIRVLLYGQQAWKKPSVSEVVADLLDQKERDEFKKAVDKGDYYQISLKDDSFVQLDRDPNYFAPILNYLRHGKLIYDHGVSLEGILEEAEYFKVDELIEMIHQKRNAEKSAPLQKACNE